jgi:hypothetical protein
MGSQRLLSRNKRNSMKSTASQLDCLRTQRLLRCLLQHLPACLIALVSLLTVDCMVSQPAIAQEQDWIQAWVFNGRTEASVRLGLQNQAEQKLDQLKENCQLTDEQHTKLKLAAAGDINRFFHEVALARKATTGLDQQDQNAVQEAWNVVSPLTTRLTTGLFGEKSLFAKVMARTLDASQVIEYRRLLEEQLERRYHAVVLTTVSTIEDSLPLVREQRAQLIELLDRQKLKSAPQQGMETYIGYAKLAKVPDAELEKIFDKDQLKTLQSLRQRYAPVVQMFGQ